MIRLGFMRGNNIALTRPATLSLQQVRRSGVSRFSGVSVRSATWRGRIIPRTPSSRVPLTKQSLFPSGSAGRMAFVLITPAVSFCEARTTVASRVMDEFRKKYNDVGSDESAIEKENAQLREAVISNAHSFIHPYLSQPWYWRILYKLGRYIYLALLWTPCVAAYGAVALTRSVYLREKWLDYLMWTVDASGCSFVKMAQWASMRPDMFSPEIVERAKKLQSFTCPHTMSHTRREIKASFGADLEDIFDDFDPVPIASGSIAQVHSARLKSNGAKVAVKVRHPRVLLQSYVDTEIIFKVVEFLQLTIVPFDKDGWSEHIAQQIDLTVEAENLRLFRANFKREVESGHLAFPQVVEDFVSSTVLVETWCDGREVSHFFCEKGWGLDGLDKAALESMDQDQLRRNQGLARTVFDVYMKMFLRDNYVHGDLHGGNMLFSVTKDSRLSIIDVGLASSLSRDMENAFAMFMYSMLKGDVDGLVNQIVKFNENDNAFSGPKSIQEFRTKIHDVLVEEISLTGDVVSPTGDPISLGNIVGGVMRAMNQYNVMLKTEIASALCSLSVGEGLIRQLDPAFDVTTEAVPYFARYAGSGMLREFVMQRFAEKMNDSWWGRIVSTFFGARAPASNENDYELVPKSGDNNEEAQ